MKTVHDIIRKRLLVNVEPPVPIDIGELYRTQWSEEFEQLMRNRLVMGAIRYGKMKSKGKPKYDRVKYIKNKLKVFKKTGNSEALVDIANTCLLMFAEEDHDNFHFCAEDDGMHTEIKE